MEDYKLKYEEIKREFESYQSLVENSLQRINSQNVKLEKDISALVNIIEISTFINSKLSDKNLTLMINDMVIGVLGVISSTILLEENGELKVKDSTLGNSFVLNPKEEEFIKEGKDYILNSSENLRLFNDKNLNIKSVMGVPIQIRDKFIGYIIVESNIENFLKEDKKAFLMAISNQVAIALENSILYKELKELTEKDPLLGIYNRRYFLNKIYKYANENENKPYALVMIDLDNFKSINDKYGHQFGDKVLVETTEVIKRNLSKDDILARYGGEELIILKRNIKNIEETFKDVEKIRIAIEKNVIKGESFEKTITASFGVGFYPKDSKDLTKVIKKADSLLYEAKDLGKNRVLVSS